MDTGAATLMSATLEIDATSIRAVLADPLLYPPSHVPSACTSSTSSELPAPPQSCQQHGCAAPPRWGSVFCDEHLQKCAAANCKRVAVRGGSVCRAHGGAALGCTKIAQVCGARRQPPSTSLLVMVAVNVVSRNQSATTIAVDLTFSKQSPKHFHQELIMLDP